MGKRQQTKKIFLLLLLTFAYTNCGYAAQKYKGTFWSKLIPTDWYFDHFKDRFFERASAEKLGEFHRIKSSNQAIPKADTRLQEQWEKAMERSNLLIEKIDDVKLKYQKLLMQHQAISDEIDAKVERSLKIAINDPLYLQAVCAYSILGYSTLGDHGLKIYKKLPPALSQECRKIERRQNPPLLQIGGRPHRPGLSVSTGFLIPIGGASKKTVWDFREQIKGTDAYKKLKPIREETKKLEKQHKRIKKQIKKMKMEINKLKKQYFKLIVILMSLMKL